MGIFYMVTSFLALVWRPLRRTLVLQQFFSAIVAVACPERSEGFFPLFIFYSTQTTWMLRIKTDFIEQWKSVYIDSIRVIRVLICN